MHQEIDCSKKCLNIFIYSEQDKFYLQINMLINSTILYYICLLQRCQYEHCGCKSFVFNNSVTQTAVNMLLPLHIQL